MIDPERASQLYEAVSDAEQAVTRAINLSRNHDDIQTLSRISASLHHLMNKIRLVQQGQQESSSREDDRYSPAGDFKKAGTNIPDISRNRPDDTVLRGRKKRRPDDEPPYDSFLGW